jgi:hypothetical protein
MHNAQCTTPNEGTAVETGEISRRLKIAVETARRSAAEQRSRDEAAHAAYDAFLHKVATPLARQLANVLKVEGMAFTVFTPADGLRLSSDRNRDDYVELALERGETGLQVVGHVSRVRGSRTLAETLPVKEGARIDALGEEDLLEFLLKVLRPWLER